MAFIYKRKNSPFWWINYRNPVTGKRELKSTGCRIGSGPDKRRAEEIEAEKTLAERQAPAAAIGKWDSWVTDFIKEQVSGRTSERYLSAWRTLRMFLDETKIICPRDVTYQNCSTYLKWRADADHKNGKYNAGKNTAILEFKIFRWIMREAVKRGYCQGNPAREVVVKRAPRKIFPDLSDAKLKEIFDAIQTEPEPDRTQFKHSFAVALLHGVRLNETNVNPLQDVNLTSEMPTIRFFQKGGRERIKPLHPQLFKFFKTLQDDKAKQTYPMDTFPDGRLKWGGRWTKFFVRHGIKSTEPNACFHSLRVTVENVLREAGIPKEIREAYLSHEHGNQDVNARYDRIKTREMRICHEPLKRSWLE
jgi:site-specific recombinase XerC